MSVRHPLAGRDDERRTLAALVRGELGETVFAVLEGEAGAGKTAVWEEALADAAAAGVRVLAARATQAEAVHAYTAVDDLFRPTLGLLSGLPVAQRRALGAAFALGDASSAPDPRVIGLGLLSLLGALAEQGRVVLGVDDWQWLDTSSAAVLAFVVRRVPAADVAVVATARTGTADDRITTLVRGLSAGEVLEIPLAPLSDRELAAAVLARTGVRLSPPAAARVHAGSRGNPLTAIEIVRTERSGGPVEATDVRRLLGARVASLAEAARDALRVIAALSDPTTEMVEAALGEATRARAGVEEGLAAEVIERDGERLRLGHPLMAGAIRQHTSLSEWRALHRRLADLAPDPEQSARHLAQAAAAPDADTAAALDAASELAAARGAPAAAAELAERAAELTPHIEIGSRARRILAAADAHTLSGDGGRAETLLRSLVAELQAGRTRSEALRRLAYVVTDGSDVSLLQQALSEAGDDDALQADIHMNLAVPLSNRDGAAAALSHADAAVRHAERDGAASLVSRALVSLADTRCWAGEGIQRRLLHRAAELEPTDRPAQAELTARGTLGDQLLHAGDLVAARDVLAGELARAQLLGDLFDETVMQGLLALLEARAGRYPAADAHADRSLELGLAVDMSNLAPRAHILRALVDSYRGREARAREHAQRGIDLAGGMSDILCELWARQVLGFLELSLGHAAAAVEWLLSIRAPFAALGIREPFRLPFHADLAEALVLTGDLDGARAVQAELEDSGRGLSRPVAVGCALRCRGMIASAEGRHDHAVDDHRAALEILETAQHPLEYARTRVALGTTQRRIKQRGAARATLQAAQALFAELGAELWEQRAQAEIHRLGGRPTGDRDELTPTEHRVAQLAAEGQTNREIAASLFVTEGTVEANLTRAYRKLGVRSRTELARQQLDLATDERGK